jgi:hypothetical protein
MSIFNLFGSKTSDDDDDEQQKTTGYTLTHYRDDPFYQELLGISEEDRERERQAERRVDDDDSDKKGWFGLW